ncbi:MAG: phage portal protein, partial [Alicyclobacillus sp.]|nr:phage portal protein [Alicyclobacillus sp.]
LANSWRPMILQEGMKYSRIPMPLADAQFVQTRQLNRDEICGLFRVPPHLIASLERATYSNIEQQSLEFVMYSLMPYIKGWEQELNRKLFSQRERALGYYVKFNVDALLRADYKTRMEGLHIMRQDGVLSANEWRAMEDMNPRPDPGADTLLVNGNMISVETASEQPPRTPQGGGE